MFGLNQLRNEQRDKVDVRKMSPCTYVIGFAKTLHLHTSNFLTLAIHNFESRKATVLKFSNIIKQC